MATQNKNVRMGDGALGVLRALKYDLDESDGAIMEQALQTRAIERLREHVEEVERIDRGLPAEGRRGEHATAAQVLLTALNQDKEQFRWVEGRLERRFDHDERAPWFTIGESRPIGSPLVLACRHAAMDEVRELGCYCVDLAESALSLTRPGSPGCAVLQALGVDAAALRETLLPVAAHGDLPVGREIPFGARAADALVVEPQAEAWRLGDAMRTQPEHLVLAVLRAARGDLLLALEAHAATYHLLRLRLTARPTLLPWSADLVRVLVRAHALARQARRSDLYPNLVMLALAEEGPQATPDVDSATLRDAVGATELCRPAAEPLPASIPVALGWNLGSSLLVGEALRHASALALDAGREQVATADVFVGLCRALHESTVQSDISLQQTCAALAAAGWRPEGQAGAV